MVFVCSFFSWKQPNYEFYCPIKGLFQASAVWVIVTLCFKTLRGLYSFWSPISATSAELVPIATAQETTASASEAEHERMSVIWTLLKFVTVRREILTAAKQKQTGPRPGAATRRMNQIPTATSVAWYFLIKKYHERALKYWHGRLILCDVLNTPSTSCLTPLSCSIHKCVCFCRTPSVTRWRLRRLPEPSPCSHLHPSRPIRLWIKKKTTKNIRMKMHNMFGFHMPARLETGDLLSSASSEQIMFYTRWAELNVAWPKASFPLQTTVHTGERPLCHVEVVTSNGLYKDINT